MGMSATRLTTWLQRIRSNLKALFAHAHTGADGTGKIAYADITGAPSVPIIHGEGGDYLLGSMMWSGTDAPYTTDLPVDTLSGSELDFFITFSSQSRRRRPTTKYWHQAARLNASVEGASSFSPRAHKVCLFPQATLYHKTFNSVWHSGFITFCAFRRKAWSYI
jgi:hypothetical protein